MGALGPPMGALGPPMGSQGGPLGTHGAMDPGLWGPMGQGTHWPRTRASGDPGLRGPGASGDPGPMGPRLVTRAGGASLAKDDLPLKFHEEADGGLKTAISLTKTRFIPFIKSLLALIFL